MDLIPFDKIVTLALFMGALGMLWLLVQRHRGRLSAPLQRGRRLRASEATSLGPAGRALILQVDGRDYLVVQVKGSGLAVQPLPHTRPEDAA
jgi:flagellar biogenesis protein FliO